MANTPITNKIRRLRFDHGEMTQQELAERVGVTRQTVNAIELGKYSPSLEVAFRIAVAFGVKLEDVFSYDAGEAERRVARLLCAGSSAVAPWKAEYSGIESCAAAVAVGGGGKGCAWGCVGLADCAVSCDFDAIHMSDFDLPLVDPELCTACNPTNSDLDCFAPCYLEGRCVEGAAPPPSCNDDEDCGSNGPCVAV